MQKKEAQKKEMGSKNYAIIDIETGGFSKEKNGICEIAVLIVNSSLNVEEEFTTLIKPYKREPQFIGEDGNEFVSYKESAMQVNGIDLDEMEEKGLEAEEVGVAILNILKNWDIDTIVGHNVKSFDKRWVEYFMSRFGDGFTFDFLIDTLILARDKFGKGGNSLPELAEKFGVVNQDEHRALGDCYATLGVWENL